MVGQISIIRIKCIIFSERLPRLPQYILLIAISEEVRFLVTSKIE